MAIAIYRAVDLYNTPATKARPARRGKSARKAKPARRGLLNISRSTFYAVVESQLERVPLGEKIVGYTDRSVDRLIKNSIEPPRVP